MRFPARTSLAAFFVAATVVPVVVSSSASADPIEDQRQRVAQITDQLEELERQSDILAEQYVVAVDTQRQLEAEAAEAEADVKAQEAQLAELDSELSTVAVQAYMNASGSGLGPMFSDTSGLTDGLQRDQLARVALDAGSATTDDYDAALTDLNEQRDELADKREQAEQQAETVENARGANEEQRAEYQQARTAAEAELGNLIKEEEERRARESYERMLAEQAAARAEQEAQAAAAQQAAEARAAQTRQQAQAQQVTNAQRPQVQQQQQSQSQSQQAPQQQQQQQQQQQPQAPAPQPEAPAPPAASGRGAVAVSAARSQLGVAYKFAAATPGVAFDCSGLTKYAWAQAGVSLPHQSAQQYASTPHVSKDQAQPGDLIFYYSPISHVGIYQGGGSQIHAPNTGSVVSVATVNWGRVVGVSRPG